MYSVKPGTRFELINRNGGVTIQQWDKAEAQITAVKKTLLFGDLDDVKIQVDQGETLRVETVYLERNPKVTVEYDIRVPGDLIVNHVKTSNGAINVHALKKGS
jgi:hypothetical protein